MKKLADNLNKLFEKHKVGCPMRHMGHPELETVDGRRRMRQHPYKSTETGSQACITEKAGDCIVKAETPFERNVIDGIKTIIELLEKSQRTKSISDIFKT